ncbi:hypothetical protein [Streptomyces sp. RFCAC02]|uniref:hypothetical protein n=1 Tax=Streptomyces sp. RFCAC02 TaxID=2499143 RepID=UPI00101F5452|nr:hypothetical protein [Streptomyces sp. RFCAC02]
MITHVMPYITGEHAPDTTTPPPAVPDRSTGEPDEARGCLFALSQPPLMLFLAVIGTLLLIVGVHDQFLL